MGVCGPHTTFGALGISNFDREVVFRCGFIPPFPFPDYSRASALDLFSNLLVWCKLGCVQSAGKLRFLTTRGARTSRKCESAVLLSCVVEVSLTRKRVHARLIVSSVNIVFEDSRGAQVEYTGALCTLLSTQRSTAPVP